MNWVRDAHDKYRQIIGDFRAYKTENNKLVSQLSKQYADDVLAMKGRLDQFSLNATMMKNKIDIIDSSHKDFVSQRNSLFAQITAIEKKLVELEDDKLDVTLANENFIELKNIVS